MQNNKEITNNIETEEAEQPQLSEAVSSKQKIARRISYIRNALKLPINPSVGAQAIANFINTSQKNPKSPQYDVLRKLSRQHRDTVMMVNSVVPIGAVVNASDNQIRRIVRDALREQKEMLAEEFQPPAMLMLKRQAIRQFPDGQRVVLYTDNKYGLTFTVPYDARGRGFVAMNVPGMPSASISPRLMSEEVESPSVLTLASGEEVYIDNELLESLEKVFSSLTEENQQIMINMLQENKESFDRVAEFAEQINENKAVELIANALAKRSAAISAAKQNLPTSVVKTPEFQRSIAVDAKNKALDLQTAGKAAAAAATAAGVGKVVGDKIRDSRKK